MNKDNTPSPPKINANARPLNGKPTLFVGKTKMEKENDKFLKMLRDRRS